MDTRSRKWTNKVLITLVMIVMTLSGIYGLNTIHNMAVTGDNSFSLDEQDQSDYIKHTQMSLFDKWADTTDVDHNGILCCIGFFVPYAFVDLIC